MGGYVAFQSFGTAGAVGYGIAVSSIVLAEQIIDDKEDKGGI
ncbi:MULTISPECIES: hypothetical protein [Streptococcus]|nr:MULTISPECIES: hypothetical protein [Streptococcus]